MARAMDEMPALYGISREEFVRMTGEGLISPELCATGLVGTVLHARAFHGQQVGHGSGLTRLELGADGRPLAAGGETAGGAVAGAAAAAAGVEAAAAVPAQPADGPVQAVELNRQLVAILSDNVREYAELPLFQRTVVRRMFQQATGLKVEDWLAIARAMSVRLEGGSPDPPALKSYRGRLKRLGDYIARQEHDARGYLRDPEKLRVALAALAARLDVVRRLEAALAELAQG